MQLIIIRKRLANISSNVMIGIFIQMNVTHYDKIISTFYQNTSRQNISPMTRYSSAKDLAYQLRDISHTISYIPYNTLTNFTNVRWYYHQEHTAVPAIISLNLGDMYMRPLLFSMMSCRRVVVWTNAGYLLFVPNQETPVTFLSQIENIPSQTYIWICRFKTAVILLGPKIVDIYLKNVTELSHQSSISKCTKLLASFSDHTLFLSYKGTNTNISMNMYNAAMILYTIND